jgi:hypothetical protein
MLKQQKRSKRTNASKLNSKEQGTFAKRNAIKRRDNDWKKELHDA